jgi:hypothetical protein
MLYGGKSSDKGFAKDWDSSSLSLEHMIVNCNGMQTSRYIIPHIKLIRRFSGCFLKIFFAKD